MQKRKLGRLGQPLKTKYLHGRKCKFCGGTIIVRHEGNEVLGVCSECESIVHRESNRCVRCDSADIVMIVGQQIVGQQNVKEMPMVNGMYRHYKKFGPKRTTITCRNCSHTREVDFCGFCGGPVVLHPVRLVKVCSSCHRVSGDYVAKAQTR